MTKTLVPMTRDNIERAVTIVMEGGVIAYPTDTVYGLGCDPKRSEPIKRLIATKGREGKPLPVLCDTVDSAASLVKLDGQAMALARRYWPGALTIVAPLRMNLPWDLHQGSGALGVRVPASRQCLELLHSCGGLLTGTSANVSGRPSCRSADEVMDSIGEKLDLVLDGGRLTSPESTVVRVTGARVEILRRGAVALAV